MPSAIHGRTDEARRLWRTLAICLLVIASSGIVPAAAPCFDPGHRCADKGCICKNRPSSAMRAPCPCCPSGGSRVGVMHDLGPAVLTDLDLAFDNQLAGEPGLVPATVDRSFLPAVPHPPPRAPSLI